MPVDKLLYADSAKTITRGEGSMSGRGVGTLLTASSSFAKSKAEGKIKPGTMKVPGIIVPAIVGSRLTVFLLILQIAGCITGKLLTEVVYGTPVVIKNITGR